MTFFLHKWVIAGAHMSVLLLCLCVGKLVISQAGADVLSVDINVSKNNGDDYWFL